eukprot:c6958_g1_i1.p1 GENE.c6958_g1_i1~~c6958_g1_i1.p1  ORF type:complete len:419 (-),score=123.62 c6958_g1_i1:4-1227(-)
MSFSFNTPAPAPAPFSLNTPTTPFTPFSLTPSNPSLFAPASTPAPFSFSPNTAASQPSFSFGTSFSTPNLTQSSSSGLFSTQSSPSLFSTQSAPSMFASTQSAPSFSTPSMFSGFGGATGSGFGATGGGFGGSQSFGGAFGTAQPLSLGGNTFGMSQSSFGMSQSAFGAQPAPTWDLASLDMINEAYNPRHPNFRFKFMLYNAVENPSDPRWAPPPNSDMVLLARANSANPDPKSLIPVQACGFTDLEERTKINHSLTTQHANQVKNMTSKLEQIHTKLESEIALRVTAVKRRHIELSQQVIKVMGKMERLEAMDKPLGMEELVFRTRLEEIDGALHRPRIRGKLHELSSVVEMSRSSTAPSVEIVGVEELAKCLQQHRQGLEELVKVVQKDLRDMTKISEFHRNAK